jgi:hypothetical protein
MTQESNVPVLCLSTSNIEKLNEIDLDRLFLMWAGKTIRTCFHVDTQITQTLLAFSKNKGNLEHGARLENLSWRFWYHKQCLPDGSNNLSTLNSFKSLIYSFDEQNFIPLGAQKKDINQTNHAESSDNRDQKAKLQDKAPAQQQQENNFQGIRHNQDQSNSPPLQNDHLVKTSSIQEPTEIANNEQENNHTNSETINNDSSLQYNEQESKQKTQTTVDEIEGVPPLMFSKRKPTKSNSASLLSDSLRNGGLTTYFKPSILIKPLDEDLQSSISNSVSAIENQNSTMGEADMPDIEQIHDNYKVW